MKLSQNIESGSYDNKLIFSVVTNPYVGKAIMTEGPDFNNKLRSLTAFETVTMSRFKRSSVPPAISMNVKNIEDETSDYGIKLWIDPADSTAYYYTEADKVYLNEDSNRLFYCWNGEETVSNISDIDLSGFDTSDVMDMGFMFFWNEEYYFIKSFQFRYLTCNKYASDVL